MFSCTCVGSRQLLHFLDVNGRSPLTRRREGLLELLEGHAHARNIQTRRGGRQARAGTRARGIHRGLLQLLKEHVFRLLAILAQGPCHRALSLRIQQIDQRLVFLRDNWVEDKRVVLPGLRDWPELRVVEPDIEIESASEVESILYLSSDEEQASDLVHYLPRSLQQPDIAISSRASSSSSSIVIRPTSTEDDERYVEDPNRPFGSNDLLNTVFHRLRDQGCEGGHCGHCRRPGCRCECEKFKSQSKSNYWFDSQYGDSDDSLPQLPIQPKKSCLLKKSSVPEPRKQVVFGIGEDELVMFANHPEDQEWRQKVPMADAMEVLEPPDRRMYGRKYRESLLALMNGQPFLTSTLHKDDVWHDKVWVEYMKWFGNQKDYNRPWYSIKRRHMKWNFERECFEDVDLVWNVQDWNAIAASAVAANAAWALL